MIDWSKPLELRGNPVAYIGPMPSKELLVVLTHNNLLYRVNIKTGKVENFIDDTWKVQNVKPDWEKAFDQYCIEEDDDRTEEYIFKRGFELGRSWK
jgi:hypothetical protein